MNLTPRAWGALDAASTKTGDNATDTLNRALVCFDLLLDLIDAGGGRLTVIDLDGTKRSVHLL